MKLVLWRHADAEPANGKRDADRSLTKKGREQAKRGAEWLRPRIDQKWRVLVSPARRTLQTVEALECEYEESEEVGLGATEETVLRAAEWPSGRGLVLVVGHQPTLGEVAERLLGEDVRVRKGAILWIVTTAEKSALEELFEP